MTQPKPQLSIIIISFNTAHITKECIESIYGSFTPLPHVKPSSLQFEIIVIDNNSTDTSIKEIKKLQEKHSNIVLIENKENDGFAKANNLGVTKAQGDYLLFLNSDIVVLPRSIEKLFYFFSQHEEEINFLGGRLLNKDKTPQASCGPFYSLTVIFWALFMRGDYWGKTRSSPNNIKEVDWVSGACILTKGEYFESIQGFDEKIFMYMDEIDLLYRAKQKGYSVFYYPDAEFIHLGSASSGGKTYPILQVYRGFIYFYKKHYSGLSLTILKSMLQLKALVALVIGRLLRNKYLIQTYEEAFRIARMA
ncbi:MAG: glycosyltransferase family 2 protein [bacterium]|nr:glycosyltransferase family 2 protein [bacterium]